MTQKSRMLVMLAVSAHVLSSAGLTMAQAGKPPPFETYALEFTVADLDEAVEFYRDVVGFERQDDGTTKGWAFLGLGKTRLVLRENTASGARKTTAVTLNLYVADLERTISTWRKEGVEFATEKPEPFALGTAIRLHDPAGNSIHLLSVTAYELPAAKTLQVFNVGLSLGDLVGAEAWFAETLEIPTSTRAYLPTTLALKKIGAFAMVLHRRESANREVGAVRADRPRIVFATGDLAAARASVRSVGQETSESATGAFWHLPSFTFEGSEGHAFRVVEVPAFAVPARAAQTNTSTIADLAWIQGNWTRSNDDGILRETWSEPSGGQMMGMFQWIKDGKTWINEFCTITETDGEIAFRLRHFSGRMIAWETKDSPFYYPLKSVSGRKAVFENPMRNSPRQFIFSRPDEGTLQIEVVGFKSGEESGRWVFKYARIP